MHYAVEGHTILELRALYLPMNALCRIVEIGCTISEIRADCLYLAGKRCNASSAWDGLLTSPFTQTSPSEVVRRGCDGL